MKVKTEQKKTGNGKRGQKKESFWQRLKNGMRSRFSLTIIIVAALLLQLISTLQYSYTRRLLTEELEKRAESELSMKAIIVKNTLNMSENSLMGHVWDLKRNLFHPDSTYSVMEWVLRSHPNLTGCWVAFEPYYFPEKGRLFEPYAWRDGDEIRTTEIAKEGRDYTNNKYYKLAHELNKPIWTDAYRDRLSKVTMVTYLIPIHDHRDSTVALFGLDISTELLGDTLNYRHVYPSSFDILLTSKGELLAYPNPDSVSRATVENVVRIINDSTVAKGTGKSGRCRTATFHDPDDDEKGYVYFAPFKGSPDWQIAVVCYDKEAFGKLRTMRRIIGWLMLAGIIVLGIIIMRFARNANRLQAANLEQERLGSELRIANNIQQQMLPETFPPYPDRNDIDIYGALTPAREVGGDLFDFFLRNEKLFFCIGDVSGKGVPSAMVMAVAHALFRAFSAHESNPARIMQAINEATCERNTTNMFVTFFIGVLDLPTGLLRYCNAGHDAPYVLENGKWSALSCKPHLPVGLFNDVKYGVQEMQLNTDSKIFLYTDGLTEAMDGEWNQFGLQRVEEVLGRCADRGLNLVDTINTMSEAVRQFVKGAEQSDDLTMMVVSYTPQRFESILDERITLKNNVDEVTRLSNFQKTMFEKMAADGRLPAIDKSTVRKLRLAIEEAVVNVINYAYPDNKEGDIEVRMATDGRRLKVVITDSGVAFDPTTKEKADTSLAVEERQVGGLGILLIREIMDVINYERSAGRNVLTLMKNILH